MKSRQEKINACCNFYESLVMILWGTHQNVGSCNHDMSAYLVPDGTKTDITYHSKPAKSFRISDHWNWYANVKKCQDENYIQCHSVDVPEPTERMKPGYASLPVNAIQVALLGADGNYHAVFGERYDRNTGLWSWVENNPLDIAALVL